MCNTDYYSTIAVKSDGLFDYLLDISYNKLNWTEHFGFDLYRLNPDWIIKDSGLNAIHNLYPISEIGLLRIPPNSSYAWHTDEYRLATVNMLIRDKHSLCLFGKAKEEYYVDMVQLKYKPYTYYLLNTQEFHSVVNFQEYRYAFSLYFEDELNYQDIKRKLHPILEYDCPKTT